MSHKNMSTKEMRMDKVKIVLNKILHLYSKQCLTERKKEELKHLKDEMGILTKIR